MAQEAALEAAAAMRQHELLRQAQRRERSSLHHSRNMGDRLREGGDDF